MEDTETTTTPTPADGTEKTHRLYMMPLPEGGTVDAKEALRWLREDYDPYQQLANNLTAQGRTPGERDAACFLGMDVQSMVEACAAIMESGRPARFERADADKPEFEDHTVALARVVGARRVLDHSRGPFEWAFDELGEELVKRIAEPLEAESKRRAAEWKPRTPPLSEVAAQEEGQTA